MKVTHDFLKKLILEELNRSLMDEDGTDKMEIPKKKKPKKVEPKQPKKSPEPPKPIVKKNVRSAGTSPNVAGEIDLSKTGAHTPASKQRRNVNIDQLANQPDVPPTPRKKVNIDQLANQSSSDIDVKEPTIHQKSSPEISKPEDEQQAKQLRQNVDKQSRILLFYERMLQDLQTPEEIKNIVSHIESNDTFRFLQEVLGIKDTITVRLSSLLKNPMNILKIAVGKLVKEVDSRLEMKLSEGFEMPTIEKGVSLESLLEEVDKMHQKQKSKK